MTREERDMGELVSPATELAEEIALYEQYQAWQEVQRGDVRAIQRRLTKLLGDQVTHVTVGQGVIRHREEDAA